MTKKRKKGRPGSTRKNVGRRVVTDYYETNRAYSRANEEAYREKYGDKKQPWTGGEKGLLIAIIIIAVMAFLRFVVFRG